MRTTIITCIATAMFFAGCTSEEPRPIEKDTVQTYSASDIRTIDEVIQIATDICGAFSTDKSRTNRSVNGPKSVFAIGQNLSRNVSPDTLIYAVEYENNQGFALIAASNNVAPVLAFIEEGSFYSLETVENESFQEQVRNMANTLASIPSNGGTMEPVKFSYEITRFVDAFYEPKTLLNWGQRYPEGVLYDNQISGCTQTAVAILCSAVEMPKSINYTYPGATISYETLDWSEIKKHKDSPNTYYEPSIASHLSECEASESTHTTISRFVREIGERTYAETLGPNGTSSNIYYAQYACTQLMPDNTVTPIYEFSSEPEEKSLSSFLKDGMVAYVRGSSDTSGHAWVADGGKQFGSIKEIHYVGLTDPVTGKYPISTTEYITRYIHYNWGWNGHCNGYFVEDILVTSQASSYDNPDTYNSYNYDYSSDNLFFCIK